MLPEAYLSQVQHIQASPKFKRLPNGEFQPVPFAGYSVITPPWCDETGNEAFYARLQTLQQQMLQQLPSELVVPVPPDSFHLTLADLIWDSAYHHAADDDPTFEPKLCDRIADSFQKFQVYAQSEQPIIWQAFGLIVRTRGVGVCLVPKNEESYERILQLRRAIYQNSALMGLGIEQQYHFTAHVTLGYFSDATATVDRDRLGQTLTQISQSWLDPDAEDRQEFQLRVNRAELRKFEDMTRYDRDPGWAVLEL